MTIRGYLPAVWQQVPREICGVEKELRSGLNVVPMDRGRKMQLPRAWDDISVDDTSDYNELLTWGIQNAPVLPIWQQFPMRPSL